jgi:hypothetical protein
MDYYLVEKVLDQRCRHTFAVRVPQLLKCHALTASGLNEPACDEAAHEKRTKTPTTLLVTVGYTG